ncbi:MAG: hypothetical protein QOD59_1981 [Mycobacterium sp.]|nr:hypothetical protein [Mycobacterium sp.]
MVMVTVQYMWIDDTSADVIKVDFEALYHGDFLVEGDTSEQLDDEHTLRTEMVSALMRGNPEEPCLETGTALVLRQRGPAGDEGFLQYVIRALRPNPAHKETVKRGLVPSHKGIERALVTLPCLVEQRGIRIG